jgi:hypothetical protein
MRDRKGHERDIRVLVDYDGHRTLFQLVEVGSGDDVLRLAPKLHAPAVVVDIGLPALTALDAMPGGRHSSVESRLVLLNVRTMTSDVSNGVVVRTAAKQNASEKQELAPGLVRLPDAGMGNDGTRVTDAAAHRNKG